MEPSEYDHGLFYELKGRLRSAHGEPDEGLIDNLRNPDWGLMKNEAVALHDLSAGLIQDGPHDVAEMQKRHLKNLDDIEKRALRIAAYARALALFARPYIR